MAQPMSRYKFVLLGDQNVGKTSFFLRLKHDRFVQNITDELSELDHLEYTQIVDGTTVTVSTCPDVDPGNGD